MKYRIIKSIIMIALAMPFITSCEEELVFPAVNFQVGIRDAESNFIEQSSIPVSETVVATLGDSPKDRAYYLNYSVWWGDPTHQWENSHHQNPELGKNADTGQGIGLSASKKYAAPGTYRVVLVAAKFNTKNEVVEYKTVERVITITP